MVRVLSAMLLVFLVAACGTTKTERRSVAPNPHVKVGEPYKIKGVWYVPKAEPYYDVTGMASWYGPGFHGKLTANGEVFDEDRLTAAHPTLPLPSIVEVTNPVNGRRLLLRVNDRGPFANDRILDLSKEAAVRLGTRDRGVAPVRVRYVGPGRIEDAIVRVGERERGQSLIAAAQPLPQPPVITRQPRPSQAEMILADLDMGDFQRRRVSNRGDGYYVQVGAYASRQNASAAAARLPQGQPVKLARSSSRYGQPLTLVRLGPYLHAYNAEEALATARAMGFHDALIIEEVLN